MPRRRFLAQADAIDARLKHGDPAGPLAGIPIGVKDLEDARGFVTTFGAELHANDPPAQHDSVLVALLREAGCVILGKTNTPEFGFKGVTDNRPFGATRNPWNLDYSPGGSSGGTAAALATGMIPLGTGSDGADYEGFYASVVYSYFAALGYEIAVEESSSHGRLDMAVHTGGHVFLFEFKVVELSSPGSAQAQLQERDYAAKYRGRGEPIQMGGNRFRSAAASLGEEQPIHLIGVEFSRETRNVTAFEVADGCCPGRRCGLMALTTSVASVALPA